MRSKTKFWQMVGRGTRLCKDLFGPGQDKQEFLIFDFCQNLENYNQNLPGTEGATGQPLGQRLFNARLELLGALDTLLASGGQQASEGAAPDSIRLTEAGIRRDTAGLLHNMVAGMSLDNFVVRPQRRWVEAWSVASAWERLTPEQLQEVSSHLSGLPTAVRDDDDDAKRFDLLMLRLQLMGLNAEPGFERLQRQVREIADRLSELGSIPAVRAQMLLIEAVAGEEWWVDVTIPMLEQARRHLRALVKLLDKTGRKVVYTDFEDELGEVVEMTLPLGGVAGDFERFRVKVRVFLRQHEDHIVLHKLRRNQALTPSDLGQLEQMLAASGTGTVAEFEQAAQKAQGLGLFIRSLVGMDRQAAKEALNSFVSGKTLSANQIEFVNLVVNHLTERGVMEAALLYEPPFTAYAPRGPDELFSPAQVDELFRVLDAIRATALAA